MGKRRSSDDVEGGGQHHLMKKQKKRKHSRTKTKDETAIATSTPSRDQSPSLYFKKKIQLSISVLPCGLRNVQEAAKEVIREALLLKYCQ